MRALKTDLVDEHYYRDEEWFLSHGLRYDTYDRKGPKVFAGEYACHGKGKKWNHYEAAIMEAALMTSFERNADIVHMTSPAPLFAHVVPHLPRVTLMFRPIARPKSGKVMHKK